jgi:hypothetical protein
MRFSCYGPRYIKNNTVYLILINNLNNSNNLNYQIVIKGTNTLNHKIEKQNYITKLVQTFDIMSLTEFKLANTIFNQKYMNN